MYTESVRTTSQLWTRENLAWLAGIFEGEGSLSWTKAAPVRSDGRHPGGQTLVFSIGMTDQDVLLTVREIAGLGTLYGPYGPTPPANKPHWTYRASGRSAYALSIALWPWLHDRRKANAAVTIRSWLKSHPKRSLDAGQIYVIRETVANGPRGTRARLAREYGVSTQTITNVVRGTKVYKWV